MENVLWFSFAHIATTFLFVFDPKYAIKIIFLWRQLLLPFSVSNVS